MAKKIEWLDNFAESYSKEINKRTASKVKNEVIIEKSLVKGAKIGDKVKLNGKMYKIADLDFEDEKGPGVVIEEIDEPIMDVSPMSDGPSMDPMEMEMGANPSSLGDNACTVAPERAVTDPGSVYDLDVRSQEQAKFEGEAAETEQKIQSDAVNVDLTQRSHEVKPPAPEQSVAPVSTDVMPMAPADVAPMDAAPMDTAPMDVAPIEETAPIVDDLSMDDTTIEDLSGDDVVMDDTECPECPGCPDCSDCEEDKKEEMKPLASNRIFRRIIANRKR